MSSDATDDHPTPLTKAHLAFRDCYLKIQANTSAERLWDQRLSEHDRQFLGNDLDAVYRARGTAGMWAALKGVSLPRAVIEVGHRLNFLTEADVEWLLHEIGEFLDAEEAMAAAITAGDLVLVERPRSAYWNGNEIAIDWDRENACWEFLWQLSRHAKAGYPVDRLTFGESAARDVVAKRKSRLVNTLDFPLDLIDLMVPVGRGTQTLHFPRERIRLFEQSPSGALMEWRP